MCWGGIFDLFVFNSFFKKESVSGLGEVELLEEDKRLCISLESFWAYSGMEGSGHCMLRCMKESQYKEISEATERNFLRPKGTQQFFYRLAFQY